MAFQHFVITLTGTGNPIRLSSVLTGAVGNAEPPTAVNIPCRQIIFTADPANAAAVYIGGENATVTTTSHAFSLDPTQATAVDKVILGPYESGPLHLSNFYAIGANNERLMVGVVPC